VPLSVGDLGPHLTQCHLGIPPYQVASWSIQPFGHNTPTLQTGRQSRSIGQTTISNGRPKTAEPMWSTCRLVSGVEWAEWRGGDATFNYVKLLWPLVVAWRKAAVTVTTVTAMPCSNSAKTRNLLKFAGSPHSIFGPCLMSIVAKRLDGSRCHLVPRKASAQMMLHYFPLKRGTAKVFGPCLLWPDGWMDQDAIWYGGRPRRRPHCVRRGPSSPPKRVTAAPSRCFWPISIVAWLPVSATAELLLWILILPYYVQVAQL